MSSVVPLRVSVTDRNKTGSRSNVHSIGNSRTGSRSSVSLIDSSKIGWPSSASRIVLLSNAIDKRIGISKALFPSVARPGTALDADALGAAFGVDGGQLSGGEPGRKGLSAGSSTGQPGRSDRFDPSQEVSDAACPLGSGRRAA